MADDVEMTPIGADELPPKATPFAAPAAAAPAPAAAPTTGSTVSTIRLKPVIRKPVIRKPMAPGAAAPTAPAAPVAPAAAPAAAPAPAPAVAKKQTQSLKSVTGPIPAQATLRKTGIIAEGILTPAQQQAAKSKTSRISLESAMGVAPTTASKSPAPLKTIRLRRPTDFNKPPAPSPFAAPTPAPTAGTQAETVVKPLEPIADAPVAPIAPAGSAPVVGDADVTQKKTLKLQRPGGGLKRPSLGAPTMAPAAGDGVADMSSSDVGDIPDIAPMDMGAVQEEAPSSGSAGVPGWLMAITMVASLAALLVLGAVFYFLFTEGCAPVAGDNYTAFIAM